MQDDLISALTLEVKEEVVKNYIYERRLIEEQIRYAEELAGHAVQLQEKLSGRFARMYDLLCNDEFIDRFVDILKLKEPPFKNLIGKDLTYKKDVRFIKIFGFTDQTKFRKLFLEAYRRLVIWNNKYKETYEDFQEECNAVNTNIKRFEKNHDLLTIINFLKGMDVEGLVKKHFMGENFSPGELGAVEKSLCFKPIRIETFKLIPLPQLSGADIIRKKLNALANSVYTKCSRTKQLIK